MAGRRISRILFVSGGGSASAELENGNKAPPASADDGAKNSRLSVVFIMHLLLRICSIFHVWYYLNLHYGMFHNSRRYWVALGR